MKRYFLFGGSSYYPFGGAEDLLYQADMFEDVLAKANKLYRAQEDPTIDWWNILDTVTGYVWKHDD